MRNAPPTRRTLLRWSAGLGAVRVMSVGMAQAATPPEVQAQLPQAKPAGSTRMRFFGLSIYDARLWVAPGFEPARYAAQPLALELRYLRALDGTAIASRSLQEMRRGGAIGDDTAQRWLAEMQAAFPDVREDDRITGLHQPEGGARFYFNSQLRGTVADPAFSERFFGIWLAPWTSEPRLRGELLAGLTP